MTPSRWILALVLALVTGVVSVVCVHNSANSRAIIAEQQAIELRGARDVAIRQANEEASKRVQIERYIRAAESRVDVARRQVKSHGTPEVVAALPPAEVLGVVDDQDILIQELDKRNTLKDDKIASLEIENESLRRALDASMKQARALEIANDALKHSAKSGKWIGRMQGLAIGLSINYVSGRLQK